MPGALSAELAAIASLANLAAVDSARARAALDESGVQAQDFADAPSAAVWAAVEAMIRDGREPDFFAVQARCPNVSREVLTAALMSSTTASPRERLAVVRDAGQRRRVGRALDAVRAVVGDTRRPLTEAVAEALKALEAIRTTDSKAATLDGEVVALVDVLEEVAKGNRDPVLPTGIEALDAVVGGLQPTLTVLGALPGVGKSGLLAGIVRNLSRRRVRVGFFSLEDERSWLPLRLLAESTGIPMFVLRNRALSEWQLSRVAEAMERLHGDMAHVVCDDRPGLTAADIVASARDMLTRHGVRALLVDHLGEVRLTRSERHDLDIADVLQQLRALAKTYRVPVVVACHLRRRDGLGIADEPRLTDFAFSAAVERMARVALALSKPSEDTLKVHVLKQTNGISGVAVELRFTGPAGVVANTEAPETRRNAGRMYGESDGD